MHSNNRIELKNVIIEDIKRSNVRNKNELRHILQCKYESIFGFEFIKDLLREVFNEINLEIDDPKYDINDILIYIHELENIKT